MLTVSVIFGTIMTVVVAVLVVFMVMEYRWIKRMRSAHLREIILKAHKRTIDLQAAK